jgi:hypothetical protein
MRGLKADAGLSVLLNAGATYGTQLDGKPKQVVTIISHYPGWVNRLNLDAILTALLGIVGLVATFTVTRWYYQKSKQDIQVATETILGKIVQEKHPPQAPAAKPIWVGRKLTVETRLHVKVDAEVIAEGVAVRVEMQNGTVVNATHQLEVEMRYALINMDSPLLVMDSEKLMGIMWARGVSPAGYSMGVVQLLESP